MRRILISNLLTIAGLASCTVRYWRWLTGEWCGIFPPALFAIWQESDNPEKEWQRDG